MSIINGYTFLKLFTFLTLTRNFKNVMALLMTSKLTSWFVGCMKNMLFPANIPFSFFTICSMCAMEFAEKLIDSFSLEFA